MNSLVGYGLVPKYNHKAYIQNPRNAILLKHLYDLQSGSICGGLLVVRHSLPVFVVRALTSFPLLRWAGCGTQARLHQFFSLGL